MLSLAPCPKFISISSKMYLIHLYEFQSNDSSIIIENSHSKISSEVQGKLLAVNAYKNQKKQARYF